MAGWMRHGRARRSKRRRLLLESLENRVLLDAGIAALADDRFEVRPPAAAIGMDVLANDFFDADYGGARRITAVSFGSQGGRVDIGGEGRVVVYTPPAEFAGEETFTYFVDDRWSAAVTVAVRSPLNPDAFVVLPDGQATVLDVLANDDFWLDYGGPRRITAVSQTELGGEVSIAADGRSIQYAPPEDAYGSDRLVYIVDELFAADVEILVTAPVRDDSYREIIQNSVENALPVLTNDPFWSGYGGDRRVTAVGPSLGGGVVSIAADGKGILYTPADFEGWDRFSYVVDGRWEASVDVQVHRPVQDDWFEVDADSADFLMRLTDNDVFTVYDSGSVTRDVIDRVTSVGVSAQGGTVLIAAGGQAVLYSAPPGFVGEDTFDYLADGQHRATVTVQVTRPVRDDELRGLVFEDTEDNPLDVLANDFLGRAYGGPRVITSVSGTDEGGEVRIADGGRMLLYSPRPGFRGTESFTYAVDGSLEARVRIPVAALLADDYHQFWPDYVQSEYVLAVLSNDHLGGHYPGPGAITAVGPTANGGQLAISTDGKSVRFRPAPGGTDRFTYTVDGKYQATSQVWFQNLLAEDSFAVDQNSPGRELRPLQNDFLHAGDYYHYEYGRPYQGPRQITAVGSTEQGGSVSIASGASLIYSPAPDFVGEDRFTYTVDGRLQSTVTVQVIRRVRDDLFRVEPDSSGTLLPVLVNDLFGADYRGGGRITAVGASSGGGTVTVDGDGQALRYTPAPGFTGHDTFVYTVDGQLKAEVAVAVTASLTEVLPRFRSLAEFEQFLLSDALERYESQFGRETYSSWGPWIYDDGSGYDVLLVDANATVVERSHSETNVQVQGVDEGDILETDGDYLYILAGSELIIADAWPAEELSVVSRTAVIGEPVAEYLYGDRVTIISRAWSAPPLQPAAEVSLSLPWYPQPRSSETWVTVLDVSDVSAPALVQKTRLDSSFVESRRIDGSVFLVLRNDQVWLPGPERLCETASDDSSSSPDDGATKLLIAPAGTCVFESREQYLERVQAELGSLLESRLPHFSSYGPDGELVRTGLMNAAEDLFRPLPGGSRVLTSVVSLAIGNDTPGISASTGIFTSGADLIYGSLGSLYVLDRGHTAEDGAVTRILQFDWDAADGGIEFVGRGEVAGRALNQFSVDEHQGYLRIATTIGNQYSGNWSGRSENALFVLHNDGGRLESVGSLKNLALDQSIRSVRFLGDRAFVTTFRDIDPLYALDLRRPEQPIPVGHVSLPGFNSYLQPIGPDHLLAVGRNTPAGQNGPTQVALFDVRDLSRPRLLDQYTLARFTTSEAELDHHAFGWYAEHQVLAIPAARRFWQRTDADGDGYRETRQLVQADELHLFRIDVSATQPRRGAVQLHGVVEHDSPVRRSAFIEDVLYSVSARSAQALSIADPSRRFAEIRWTEEGLVDAQEPRAAEEAATRMLQRARDHLAGVRGIDAQQVVVIAAESARWQPGSLSQDAIRGDSQAVPGFRIVLGVGESRFLYHTDAQEQIRLESEAFEFSSPAVTWQNTVSPEDVNRDAQVTPLDALILINELNAAGPRQLRPDHVARLLHYTAEFLLDVDGDGMLAPRDVLRIINRLNAAGPSSGT